MTYRNIYADTAGKRLTGPPNPTKQSADIEAQYHFLRRIEVKETR